MQSTTFNYEATRVQLLETLARKQAAQASKPQSAASSEQKPVKVKRSAAMV